MYGYIEDILADKGSSVYTTTTTASVCEAVQEMNRKGVGALLVLGGQQFLGIFTERDVLRRVVDEGRDPRTTRVCEVMSVDVLTIRLDAPVEEAMQVMTENRFRHLPVVDGGQLRGLVSIGDVMRRVSLHQAAEIQQLVEYITGTGGPLKAAPAPD